MSKRVCARLDHDDECVRLLALRAMNDLKPHVNEGAWHIQRKLAPAALAQYADAVVMKLADSNVSVRWAALRTLRKLGPEALA